MFIQEKEKGNVVMENTMYQRYGTNMHHIAHKYAELSAIPIEHSRLLPERPLRKFNSMRGKRICRTSWLIL